MIEWIFLKMGSGAVKALVIVAAILSPLFFVGWVWEGVSLHGIEIPFPVFGPFHLVDGAIHQRELAYQARDLAVRDRDIYKGNAERLGSGLDRCNGSVTALADATKRMDAAADALVKQRLDEAAKFNSRLAALDKMKPSDAKCPTVDAIYRGAFQ